MRTILITGFTPFENESINPSFEAIRLLPNQIADFFVIVKELPTVFNDSFDLLLEEIEKSNPSIILMLGQAGGRKSISIERVAINIDDANIPDNQGNQPQDDLIVSDGEPAYFSTLPIKKIQKNLSDHGIATSISNSAGTFVCNHLMYQVLHHIKTKNLKIKAGFIHVPYIHEQTKDKADIFSMSLEEITGAIKLIIHSLKEV